MNGAPSRAHHSLYEGICVALYSVGDRVMQAQYGTGTVTSSNEHHTVIDFDEHGPRTFSTSLVRLERSSTAAPGKPARRRASPRKAKAPAV